MEEVSCLNCSFLTFTLGGPYCLLKETHIRHPDKHSCEHYESVLKIALAEVVV